MTLNDIKEWLSTIVKAPDGCYFAGKIDASKDNCIGIYDAEPVKPHIAIGGIQNTSYEVKCVGILVHWGKYFPAAELKAQEVFNALYGNPHNAVIGAKRVIDFNMRFNQPVSLDTDTNGIYEYAIYTNIYYSKN